MIEKGKTEIAQKTLDKYQKQLDHAFQKIEELKNKGEDTTSISQKAEDTVNKHIEVLQGNLEKAPEAAKKGLQNAIESSNKVIEKTTGEIQEENLPESNPSTNIPAETLTPPTPAPTPLYTSPITIISPIGGEKLLKGNSYLLKWYCSSDIHQSLNILLMKESHELGVSLKIAMGISCAEGENTYNWKIPTSLVLGDIRSDFRIRIETSDHAIFDESGYFNINSAIPPAVTCNDSDNGSRSYIKATVTLGQEIFADYCLDNNTVRDFTCAYDKNGELTLTSYLDQQCPYGCEDGACKKGLTVESFIWSGRYAIGRTYYINWFCGGINMPVNIFLVDKGGNQTIIVSNISCSPAWEFGDTNRYSWTIPASINPENNAFKILIKTVDNSFSDESEGYFSIFPEGSIPEPNG